MQGGSLTWRTIDDCWSSSDSSPTVSGQHQKTKDTTLARRRTLRQNNIWIGTVFEPAGPIFPLEFIDTNFYERPTWLLQGVLLTLCSILVYVCCDRLSIDHVLTYTFLVYTERGEDRSSSGVDLFSTVCNDAHHHLSWPWIQKSSRANLKKKKKESTFFQPFTPQVLLFDLVQRWAIFCITPRIVRQNKISSSYTCH